MILVGVVFFATLLFIQWREIQYRDEVARRTIDGFSTILEGIYAWRVSDWTTVRPWPASYNDITSQVPNLQIVDSLNAGANGYGNPYEMRRRGNSLFIATVVLDEITARTVHLEFPSNSAVRELTADRTWEIEVGVPEPGALSLVRSTILVDGSNELLSPLWVTNNVVTGSACTGNGMGIDNAGEVYVCLSSVWTAL